MGLPEVQARVRFLGLGLMMLALGGCATSAKKIDETVDLTDHFVAFEAEVPRNFMEFGDCIADQKQEGTFIFDYKLFGGLASTKLYDVSISQRWSLRPKRLVSLHYLDTEKTQMFVTQLYDPLEKLFIDVPELHNILVDCAGGPFENEQVYDSNVKRYKSNEDAISLAREREAIASVRLPDYEITDDADFNELMRRYRARFRPDDKLFIEKALAGNLEPLNAYYSMEYYSVDFDPERFGFAPLYLLSFPFQDELMETDRNSFYLFCAGYMVPGGLLGPNIETEERIVVFSRGRQVLDAVIVPKDHEFYQACLKGREIEK